MASRHRQMQESSQRVIDAAWRVIDTQDVNSWAMLNGEPSAPAISPNDERRWALEDLGKALAAHSKLCADLDHAAPHANRDTSVNASLFPRKGTLRRLVISTLVAHQLDLRDGMTCHELEARLRRPHQSVSPRVHELERAGWIVNSGRVRKTPTGSEAIVWVPTDKAIAAVREASLGAAS